MEPGGQLGMTTDVENYPGFPEGIMGPELMERMEQQARKFGTEVKYEWVTGVDFSGRPLRVTTTGGEYAANAIIIATGSSPRKLGIPGENELWGYGVSACATCDGALYKGKTVVVVGGGDTAAEEATFLTRFADRVHLVHRRDRLRASAVMAQRVIDNPKVTVHWNTTVEACLGEKPQGLTSCRLKNVKTGEVTELPTDGFFLAIGHQPNTGFLNGVIEVDDHGFIVTDRFQRTNIDGVFAAGDVQDHVWQQAITAAGTGCAAALAAEKYLEALEGTVYPDERRMAIAEQALTPES
jgi:thioredoxin reductase (NADPH)